MFAALKYYGGYVMSDGGIIAHVCDPFYLSGKAVLLSFFRPCLVFKKFQDFSLH